MSRELARLNNALGYMSRAFFDGVKELLILDLTCSVRVWVRSINGMGPHRK